MKALHHPSVLGGGGEDLRHVTCAPLLFRELQGCILSSLLLFSDFGSKPSKTRPYFW
jgi:hypothetical protein